MRRHLFIAVSLLAATLVLPGRAEAGPMVFGATGDATVAEAAPDVNLGGAGDLLADRSPVEHALLRFDVVGLDGPISAARLRLWVTNSTTNGPKVWRSGPFDEGTVTWNAGRPGLDRMVGDVGAAGSGRWLEVDVTGALTGPGTYAFTLVPDSTDGVDFVSREGSANQPELVVETSGPASSSTSTSSTSTSSTSSTTATTGPPPSSVGPLPAVADATVVEADPGAVDGSGSTLVSDASPLTRGLLAFRVPAGVDPGSSYRLRLWVTDPSSNGPKVWTTGVFDEATVAWAGAPPLGEMVGDLGPLASGRWVEVDVSGAVHGPDIYSFALVADATDGSDFASRETGSRAPHLVVSPGAAPEGTTTSTTAETTSTSTTRDTTTTSTTGDTTTTGQPAGSTTSSSTTTTTRPGGPSGAFEVGLIGDTGYQAVEERALVDTVDDMNRMGVTFGMHAGDIWGGAASCTESKYRKVRDTFNRLEKAFVYTPGDNEWQDCPESGRLSMVRNLFFSSGDSLGRSPIRLERQSGQPENARWEHHGIVFATMNEPGSTGSTGSVKDKNVAWLNSAFDEAERIGAAGVLIMWQDNPFRPSGGALYRLLKDRTVAFGRPVALVHGDTHAFHIDHPWSDADNFTRVEVFGANDYGEWVRATIDPSSRAVFSFRREKP